MSTDTSPLHPEAQQLIQRHGLMAHPEGGFFVERFRSGQRVQPLDDRRERSALTSILFLLDAGVNQGISRLHRVRSDEAWYHLDGDPVELTLIPPETVTAPPDHIRLGLDTPDAFVPADWWQAARTTGAWSLVACAVGPGFDFEDFGLLCDDPAAADRIRERFPEAAVLI